MNKVIHMIHLTVNFIFFLFLQWLLDHQQIYCRGYKGHGYRNYRCCFNKRKWSFCCITTSVIRVMLTKVKFWKKVGKCYNNGRVDSLLSWPSIYYCLRVVHQNGLVRSDKEDSLLFSKASKPRYFLLLNDKQILKSIASQSRQRDYAPLSSSVWVRWCPKKVLSCKRMPILVAE